MTSRVRRSNPNVQYNEPGGVSDSPLLSDWGTGECKLPSI